MRIETTADLRSSNLVRLKTKYQNLNGRYVTAGIHRDKGRVKYKDGPTVLEVAKMNEFGTFTIPARVFVRIFNAIPAERQALLNVIGAELGKSDPETILNNIGEYMVGRQRDRILYHEIQPANSPRTIAQKGFDWPLYHTGLMVGSLEFRKG